MKKGFTLIELTVTMGILALLAVLSTVLYLRILERGNLKSITKRLTSTLGEARNKSILGVSSSGSVGEKFGVHFATDSFTLFASPYVDGASDNLVDDLPSGYSFSTINLPSSEVVFSKIKGEVEGYSGTQNNVIISIPSGATRTITILQSGAIDVSE